MQRDEKKLREAQLRRGIGKVIMVLAGIILVPYAFFLVSNGRHDFAELGHLSPFISIVLMAIAVVIMKPVYSLENPFLATRNR